MGSWKEGDVGSATAECPLCDRELDRLAGWDTAPETAIARHLHREHPGWEERLGFFAEVLDSLDADGRAATGRATGGSSSLSGGFG